MSNIKLKLLIPTLLMVALSLAGTGYVSVLQYDAFRNQEKETTDKRVSILKNFVQMRRQKNLELIHLLGHKDSFLKSAMRRDRAALADEITPYFEQLEYGFVNLYDMRGKVIARADIPDMFGMKDELSPLVLEALKQNETVSTVSTYNGLLAILSIKRLMGPSSPLGALVVGNYLDQPTVDNVARANNVDLKFYLNGDEIVSSSKYNKVVKGSERKTSIDISEAGGGKGSFTSLLVEDVAAEQKEFWQRLFSVLIAMSAVSAIIIGFSRRTILSAADSLNSARISAEQKTIELKSVNEQLNTEIAERAMAEEALKRRDVVLQALNFISGRFLHASDIDENLNICVERLGAATGVSRIAIRQNYIDSLGSLRAGIRYQWVAPGIASQSENADYGDISYGAAGLDNNLLERKQPLWGNVRDLPEELRMFYEKGGVKTVLVVPIFVDSQWWGYIGFAECLSERAWDRAEIDVLGAAADIIGAAIYRKKIDGELLRTRDSAMEASNAKSLFLANMSHEIRTPMNSIIGFAHLLEKTPVNKTQKEYLHIIGNSAETLLDIINSILDFSKIESGKFELEKSEFDLFKQLEGMIETLSFRANEKNSDLIFLLDPELPRHVVSDPLRMKQVLTNLIGNALKFTDRGGYVYVKIIRGPSSGSDGKIYVSFSIEDNGIGIPKDKQASILEPFTQADYSITREYGGTGLGLAISDNIVKLMGGKLSVESEPGKGTRFYFTLALELNEQNGVVVPESANMKIALYGPRRGGPSHEEVISRYLEYLGCSVSRVDQIDQMMDIGDIDIVIMSIPPIDFEAVKSIRIITTAPIIAVAREYAVEIMEGSFDKVIYQPVYLSKLVDAIGEVTGIEPAASAGKFFRKEKSVDLNAKVLVAEDVQTNQMLIKLILSEIGVDADIAANGLEAFEKYRAGEYDAVFMDVHMPVCNGRQAAKMIRDHEQRFMKKPTPIIALTADAIKGEKERLLSEGMDDYLMKPIDMEALTSVLHKYIHKTGPAGQAEKTGSRGPGGFDLSRISKSLGITEEMARFCIQDFLSSVEGDLDELRKYVEACNRSGIREVAHKIKGTAANLRINEISDICSKVENMAKGALTADDITVLNGLIDRIGNLRNEFSSKAGRS